MSLITHYENLCIQCYDLEDGEDPVGDEYFATRAARDCAYVHIENLGILSDISVVRIADGMADRISKAAKKLEGAKLFPTNVEICVICSHKIMRTDIGCMHNPEWNTYAHTLCVRRKMKDPSYGQNVKTRPEEEGYIPPERG